MTKEDLLRMLITAYEMGRSHGIAKEQLEADQCDAWNKCKDQQLKKMRELSSQKSNVDQELINNALNALK